MNEESFLKVHNDIEFFKFKQYLKKQKFTLHSFFYPLATVLRRGSAHTFPIHPESTYDFSGYRFYIQTPGIILGHMLNKDGIWKANQPFIEVDVLNLKHFIDIGQISFNIRDFMRTAVFLAEAITVP